MTINETRNGDSMTVALEGRLDTLSSPELDTFLEKYYPKLDELILDLEKLDYLSSSGLRVLLKAHNAMKSHGGTLLIRHANQLVMGVFSVTGFDDILNIE